MSNASEPISVVADVGGTNTRVALTSAGTLRASSVKRYKNMHYSDLGAVLRTFLSESGQPDCASACVAVAGPVANGAAELTNLDWQITHETLTHATGAGKVAILNDLQAQGHGIAHIQAENLRPIVKAKDPQNGSEKIVIGVGTGFNIAAVYQSEAGQLVTASESGHISLPVQNETDLRLAHFVAKTHGFADVEEVLSGRGVENTYAWLQQESGHEGRKSAADIFSSFESGTDPVSIGTAQVFARMLGIIAGDLALIHLPFDGIYFSGGVARAFGPHLIELGFADAFRQKGRFADFMDSFSIHIIEDDFAALSGCAGHLDTLG